MTQYTKPTVLPAWGESAGGADVLQPTNAEIQAGWPLSNVPPSRKRFNWILKYLAQGVRYMMQMGIPAWDATEDYPVNARVMGSDGETYKALQTSTNQNPTTATAYWQRWGTDGRDDQLQLTTAFTTAGAAPNFTLTPLPAPAALTANLRFRVKFHASGAGADQINIAGLGNKAIKQYDSTGTKVAATVVVNQLADIEYDGTDLVLLGPSVPVQAGEVAFFAMSTAPVGYLKANGAAVSRTVYATLFAAIGTVHGAGDGSTTFNLPDLRGEFLRGFDDGRGIDAGRLIGSWQGDAIRNITGEYHQYPFGLKLPSPKGAFAATTQNTRWTQQQPGGNEGEGTVRFDASKVVPTANENRPRNFAALICIKY